MISIKQIRAGRGLLGWRQLDLARQCDLSQRAINRIECYDANPRKSTMNLVQLTLEKHGVIFFKENGYEGVKILSDESSQEDN